MRRLVFSIAMLALVATMLSGQGCISMAGEGVAGIERDTLQDEKKWLENDLAVARSALSNAETKYNTLKDEYDAFVQEHDREQNRSVVSGTTPEQLQADLAQLGGDYHTLEADYEALVTLTNSLTDSYNELARLYDQALAQLSQTQAQLGGDYHTLEADYEALVTLTNSLTDSYNELARLYDQALAQLSQTQAQLAAALSTPPTPTPQNWIDQHEAQYGVLPIVPEWLTPLVRGTDAEGRFTRSVTLVYPSSQYWALRSPSEKEMVLQFVEWLGGNRDDFLWSIGR